MTARASAGTLPPPSPWRTTSLARSASRALQLALCGGGEEASRQLVALLARGLESWSALLDVAAGSRGQLARVVLALADDLGDLGVAVVEDVVQQEGRALLRREALEQNEERERERVGELGLARRVVGAVGHERLGQPLTDVGLAAYAGGASWSIARRVVTVARNARGDTMAWPPLRAEWKRRSASWTTSSASATLPSMR